MTVESPQAIAKEAGLRYVTAHTKGFGRQRVGQRFLYFDTHAKQITDKTEIERIDTLGIPPAYIDVWICPFANGHIQAIGTDERGRQQYRYHDDWKSARQATKFERMKAFGLALPKIRRQVNADVNLPGMPREKVLATLVQLLEKTLIRVGNEEYAKQNKSYGLTTMKNQHVEVDSGEITFAFKGKSNKFHEITLRDKKLSRIVGKLQDLPGQDLFQFVDDNDNLHSLTSDDVNDYLQQITGQAFTAKDFRTWRGTVIAATTLMKSPPVATKTAAKKNLGHAIKVVSRELGNTPAVCRKAYIHPKLMELYLEHKSLAPLLSYTPAQLATYKNLKIGEAPVMVFLEAC